MTQRRYDPNRSNHDYQGDTGCNGEGPRGDQHDDAHEDRHEHQEHGGAEKPYREIEPVFQILVGGGKAETREKGNRHQQDRQQVDGEREKATHQLAKAKTPDYARIGQETDAGQERGDDADPHREPGKTATSEKVLFVASLSLGQTPPQKHHGSQVRDQHDMVGRMKLHERSLLQKLKLRQDCQAGPHC